MANPLAVFRKYEKILLVVFGVLLMIVFTVGGIVSQSMRMTSRGSNEVVVKTKSETLRESDIQNLLFSRHYLRNFMRAVNLAAAEKGANPQQSLGIPDTDAEADVVQTAILAKQAEQLGMEVSDQAVINFLTRYSQDKLGRGDFARILDNVTQRRMSQAQFFDAMRRELLAQRFISVFQRGMLPPTPEGAWDYFLRLNRQINFEAVPFEVADYLARADEPTTTQIDDLYQEGKDRYPFPDSPEPGFKKLKQVAVQYVKADLSTFLADARASITDEQIQQYYDQHREEFRNIELPAFDLPNTSDFKTGNEIEDATGVTQQPTETTGDDAVPEIDATPLPAPLPLQDDPEAEGPKINSAPEVEAVDETVTDETVTDETVTDETVTDETVTDETVTDETVTDETVTDETVTDETVTDETVTDEAVTDEAVTDPEQETPGTDSTEAPASVDEEDPLADLPEAAGNNIGQGRPEFKPLEEVADDIRTRLATPIARGRMEQALNSVRSKMRAYFGTYLAWDVSPERDSTPQPTPPDLSSLVADGLTAGETPLVNILQLQETDPLTGAPIYEISRAYDTNYVPFAQQVFANDMPLYQVSSIRGEVLDTEYLYWKTAEAAERVPELKEVRDEVVRAIKMKQALKLAQQDAEQAAEKLNQLNQRPRDAYANDPNRKVIDAESLTWMTSASVPYMPPRLSRIPGIPYPGDDFMRAVFNLPPGKAGTAVDNPQDTVYVVAVTGVDWDDTQLRDQFLRNGMTPQIAMLAQRDSQRHLQQWYAGLEKDLDLEWKRDPHPDSRMR